MMVLGFIAVVLLAINSVLLGRIARRLHHLHTHPTVTWTHDVTTKLDTILKEERAMANELADLQAAVAKEDTVVDSAIVLLQGIKAALDAAIAAGNPAALTALSADIGAKTDALSAAIVANTPTP